MYPFNNITNCKKLGIRTKARINAMVVSDDDRRSVPSLSLADSLEGLCVVGAHSNLSDIDIAVGGSNHTQILLADALTLGSALGRRTLCSSKN